MNFEDYVVCSCKHLSLYDIKELIKNNHIKTLGQLQDETKAGTGCRYCILPEADFGKIKKQIYLKDILNLIKEENNG